MNAAAIESEQKLTLNDQLRDKFQLKTEPFGDATHLFFQGAQRQHNLETLRHLVSYGDMVLLLTGGAGSGKSTLIAELGRHIVDGVHLVSLKPSLIVSPKKLALELCKRLDLQQVDGEPVVRTMERVLEVCAHGAESAGKRLLLVVDDAHKVNKESFKLLLSTFRGLGSDSGICLLVSGRQEILQSIIHEGVDPATCSWIHQIHLKPFSQEDAETYVSLRLIRAGSKVEPVFSDAQKKALHELGKGCPGRINRIAPGVLLDSFEVAKPRKQTPKGVSWLLVGIVVSLLVSFLVIGNQYNLFFFFEDGIASPDQKSADPYSVDSREPLSTSKDDKGVAQESLMEKSRADILEKIEQAEVAVSHLPDVDIEIVSADPIVENKPAGASGLVDKVVGEAVYSANGVILPGVVVSNGSAGEELVAVKESQNIKPGLSTAVNLPPEVVPEAKVAPKITEQAQSEVDKIVEPNRHSRFRSHDWLSQQQGGAYTIQVLGSRNEKTAIKYVDGKLEFSELVYIQSTYKEKPWFVVILGVYPNKAVAREKIGALPPSIKKQKPWVRSIEGL